MSLFGIKDSANVTLFSKAQATYDQPVLFADYCNQTSLNMSADTVYAMKKTAKAISWDTNREGSLTMEMQVFELRWISLLFGSANGVSGTDWAAREVIDIDASGAGTLSDAAASGSAIVFPYDSKDPYKMGAAFDATKVTLSGTSITIDDAAAKSKKVVVFYTKANALGKQITVESEKWPESYRVVMDTMIRDTDGQDRYVQFEFYNLKPKSQLELTLSAEDVCTLSVEWDVLVNNENKYFTFRYLDGADDAAEAAGNDSQETPAVSYVYNAVTPEAGANPKTQGWYEKTGEGNTDADYTLTTDEEVDSGKTYYEKVEAQG